MWLPAFVCFLFLVESAWRFEYMAKSASSEYEYGDALFNAINFLLLALMGGFCVFTPHLQEWWYESKRKKKEKMRRGNHVPIGQTKVSTVVKGVHIVIDSSNIRGLEVESKPDLSRKSEILIGIQDHPVDNTKEEQAGVQQPENNPAKPAKLVYLANLKTFLTFVVVTHHITEQFAVGNQAPGLGTWAFDPSTVMLRQPQIPWVTLAIFFLNANQFYFMGTFFLISAYFCPQSLDKKGFRRFVMDKLVRLGGPFILWSTLLGPVLNIWCDAYAGSFPLRYQYAPGPPWFILWLLNFSMLYAILAQILPTLHCKMPHPLVLLTIGVGLGGAFYGFHRAVGFQDFPNNLGNMEHWTYGLFVYIPFFLAGIVGCRNDWLRSVEEMKTWIVWFLRVFVVGMWLLIFLEVGQWTVPGLSSLHIRYLPMDMPCLADIQIPVYAIAMTLAELQLFHQFFNGSPQSEFSIFANAAAYTVYLIHPWVYNVFIVIFIEIVRCVMPVIFHGTSFQTLNSKGEVAHHEFYGFVFVFVWTQLFVWPLAHFFRKIPVLNKML